MNRIQFSRRTWIIISAVCSLIIISLGSYFWYQYANKDLTQMEPQEVLERITSLRADLGNRGTKIHNTQTALNAKLEKVKKIISNEKTRAGIVSSDEALKNKVIANNLTIMQKTSAYIDVITDEKRKILDAAIDLDYLESKADLDQTMAEGLQDKDKAKEMIVKVNTIINDVEPNADKPITPMAEEKMKPLDLLWKENFDGVNQSPSAQTASNETIPEAQKKAQQFENDWQDFLSKNISTQINPDAGKAPETEIKWLAKRANESNLAINSLPPIPQEPPTVPVPPDPWQSESTKKARWRIIDSEPMTYYEAVSICREKNGVRFNNWRIPSKVEMSSPPISLERKLYWTDTRCENGFGYMPAFPYNIGEQQCLEKNYSEQKFNVVCIMDLFEGHDKSPLADDERENNVKITLLWHPPLSEKKSGADATVDCRSLKSDNHLFWLPPTKEQLKDAPGIMPKEYYWTSSPCKEFGLFYNLPNNSPTSAKCGDKYEGKKHLVVCVAELKQ